MRNNKNSIDKSGFTLVELLVVIVVIGIIFTLFSSALLSYIQKSRIYKTQDRMETIQLAIDKYLNINDRLPCPASQTLAPGAAGFNVEITQTAALANCSAGASPAGAPRFGNNAGRLRTGAVPVRSLNLPDEYALDAWGNRFRYTVTTDLAMPGSYASDMGFIAIQDSAGNAVISPSTNAPIRPNTGHYVIVSHGENGRGAFSENGVQVTGCGAVVAADIEGQNCNNNRTYINTLLKSDVAGNGFYDDFLAFEAEERPDFQVPVGAIVAFNGVCPPTWQPADGNPVGEPDLRGQFVIGMTAPGVPIVSPQFNIAATGPTDPINYTLGLTGQDPLHMIPPFVALQYCIKN